MFAFYSNVFSSTNFPENITNYDGNIMQLLIGNITTYITSDAYS